MLEGNAMQEHRFLEGAAAATEGLSGADSLCSVSDLLCEIASAIPGISGAAVYLLGGADAGPHEEATSVARSPGFAVPAEGLSAAREAYLDGAPVVRTELSDGEPVTSLMAYPLGGYGALVVVAPDTPSLDDRARSLLSVVTTVARCQFERVERTRSLRACTYDRERYLDRLSDLDDVTDLVFGLERAVTAADSRTDMERTVTERLAALDRVAFAWIGRVETDEGRVVPTASAGGERDYLDAVDWTLAPSHSEPAVVAARDRQTAAFTGVASGLDTKPWRREALARGVQSVQAVPLAGDGAFAGVLAVYFTDDSVGSGLWDRALEHVAAIVAHGAGTRDRKRALLSDAVVEVELRLTGGDDFFSRTARAVGTDLCLDGVAARDDRLVLFLATPGCDGDAIERAIERDPAAVSVTTVQRDGDSLFEVVVREERLLSNVVDAGATPKSVEGTADWTRVVLALPSDGDVEGLVDSLERQYDQVTLRSRRERNRPVAREQYVWAKLEESLTDRQLETLRTAYLSGYFEWPRESTGEEVAELLDISQPTFSRHLRTAERKLLSLLFATDES